MCCWEQILRTMLDKTQALAATYLLSTTTTTTKKQTHKTYGDTAGET